MFPPPLIQAAVPEPTGSGTRLVPAGWASKAPLAPPHKIVSINISEMVMTLVLIRGGTYTRLARWMNPTGTLPNRPLMPLSARGSAIERVPLGVDDFAVAGGLYGDA